MKKKKRIDLKFQIWFRSHMLEKFSNARFFSCFCCYIGIFHNFLLLRQIFASLLRNFSKKYERKIICSQITITDPICLRTFLKATKIGTGVAYHKIKPHA